MKFFQSTIFAIVAAVGILFLSDETLGKKVPSRSSLSTSSVTGRRGSSSKSNKKSRRSSRKRILDDDEDEEDDDFEAVRPSSRKSKRPSSRKSSRYEEEDDDDDDFDDEDELEEEDDFDRRRSRPSRRGPPSSSKSRRSSKRRRYSEDDYDYDDEEEDDYFPRGRGGGGGRVVPYGRGSRRRPKPPSAFSRGLAAFRDSLPDPNAVRQAAMDSISAARETTSRMSSNFYRDIKGFTSSGLEQAMLSATRPDDTPVKGKHVERLVGLTYQVSPKQDIYESVLRKLWAKMAEKDWRTTIKALYILHRYSANASPLHRRALKARMRELRRTKDPKRKNKRYFDKEQINAGEKNPSNIKYRAYMARYAEYVLLRAQCFGGDFVEIGSIAPTKKGRKVRPLTMTNLSPDHFKVCKMLFKLGLSCTLLEGETCEHTAVAAELVACDLIDLVKATTNALNHCLSSSTSTLLPDGSDPKLVQAWCTFYAQELLPKTKSMLKRTQNKLDAYGLFLPSRIGATVSQQLLAKGMDAIAIVQQEEEGGDDEEKEVKENDKEEEEEKSRQEESKEEEEEVEEDEEDEEEEEEDAQDQDEEQEDDSQRRRKDEEEDADEDDDEYDYDEEYYDDEDED